MLSQKNLLTDEQMTSIREHLKKVIGDDESFEYVVAIRKTEPEGYRFAVAELCQCFACFMESLLFTAMNNGRFIHENVVEENQTKH